MNLTASESFNLDSRALYFHWDIPWFELLVTACEMFVFSLIYFYPRTTHFVLLDLINITSLRKIPIKNAAFYNFYRIVLVFVSVRPNISLTIPLN
jgi:hypothetical protein